MLTLQEAAEYLGMSPEDIMLSRMRGLPPGNMGHARNGEVFFDKNDLLPPRPAFACPECEARYKTERGLTAHLRSKHGAA